MTAKKKAPSTENREDAKGKNKTIRGKNRGQGTDKADWAGVKAQLLFELVCAVTSRDCALQFGYSRDGGAYCLRIVGDGDPYNEYVRPTEDVELHLQGIIEDFKL